MATADPFEADYFPAVQNLKTAAERLERMRVADGNRVRDVVGQAADALQVILTLLALADDATQFDE